MSFSSVFQHFVNCLQCTEEGLSMGNIRKYKVSKQISAWAQTLIAQLAKEGKVAQVEVDNN